ncbi:hypothetical protein GM182_00660 [bacterium 3DAC]|jgi:hypothetical protein|nr:hypothetical protein GM182_00660 [bacterium 3DAC]
MLDDRVPVADIIVDTASKKMKAFAQKMKDKDLDFIFGNLVDTLIQMKKLTFVDDVVSTPALVVGIDGAFATYKMFGGIIGAYVTVGAFIKNGVLYTEALDLGADVFLGEKGERTFKMLEYTAELKSVAIAVEKAHAYIENNDEAVLFVDGSLSSSMGHLAMQTEVSHEVLMNMVEAVAQITHLSSDIVFVPKRMMKDIAFADRELKEKFAYINILEDIGIKEAFAIGSAILHKRRELYGKNKKDKKVSAPVIVGPFPLHIHLAYGDKKVSYNMNTYYINLVQWRHAVLRIDVAPDKDVSWVISHVLPALDLMPRVAAIMAADEYAKKTISSAMNLLIENVFASADMREVMRLFPDYRGEGSAMHSIFYGE